jgi:AcrR family transcriptional regulator
VAGRVFFEKGYGATSTQEIADRLGMLKGSLYHYIDHKEDLLFELVQDAVAGAIGQLHATLASGLEPIEMLRTAIERHVVYLIEHRVTSGLSLHEVRSMSAERQALVHATQRRYLEAFTRIIAAGQRSGDVRSDLDPLLLTLMLVGAMNCVHGWYRDDGPLSPQEIGRIFAAVVTDGMRPRCPV